MTNYAGETLVITHTATNDSVTIDNTDVDAVLIEIFDGDGETIIAETEMTWDAIQLRWEYVWDTSQGATPIASGTYRAKVTVDGLSDTENWEYKRIRLARNPV